MATLCGAKSPTRHAEGRKESPAISYESDFLPPVKNSRCGIVTHAARAADMGAALGGHSHGEFVNSLFLF